MFKVYSTTSQLKSIAPTKKRDFYLNTCGEGNPLNTASFWDGGSKSTYSVLNIDTKQSKHPSIGVFPTFESKTVLEANEILIETGVTCGKPSRPMITCRKSELEKVMGFLGLTGIAPIREY